LDLRDLHFDANCKTVVNFVITNHGLVTANGCTFTFDSHPQFKITPAIKDLGNLAALSTFVVPVTIEKVIGCGSGGGGSGGGGGGAPTGGGGFGPPVPFSSTPPGVVLLDLCDPCTQKRLTAIVKCAIEFLPLPTSCPLACIKSVADCYHATEKHNIAETGS